MLVVLTPRLKLHQQKKNSQEKQLDVQYLNTDIHTDLCVALSKPGLSNNEKWKVYNSICLQNPDISAGEKKQFENESTWSNECINVCPDAANKSSDSPDDVEPQDKESVFICEVKCSALDDVQDGRRGKTLSRLRQRLATLNAIKVANQNEKIAEAWNIENSPIRISRFRNETS